MNKDQKTAAIAELQEKLDNTKFFYIADASTLTVEKTNELRAMCFEKDVQMQVVKNTLVKKALQALPEDRNYSELYDLLKGPTALFYSEVSSAPAKIIKEFRKGSDRPILKGAYIESSVYVGDDQIEALSKLKSKEDLLGELIGLLQSPVKNVIGSLQSGGHTLSGLLKSLEERAE